MRLTCCSYAYMTDPEDSIKQLLNDSCAGAMSRKILGHIQFEDAWQEYVEDYEIPYLHIAFKLAPDTIEMALKSGKGLDFCSVSWIVLLPNPNYITKEDLPKFGMDFLYKAKLKCYGECDEDDLNELIEEVVTSYKSSKMETH